jgi:hypothetical protein
MYFSETKGAATLMSQLMVEAWKKQDRRDGAGSSSEPKRRRIGNL